jgi:hypothetical protein
MRLSYHWAQWATRYSNAVDLFFRFEVVKKFSLN